MILEDLKCCGICLVRSQCNKPCDKYYKMMRPLEGILKAFVYVYDKIPYGKIYRITEPVSLFVLSSTSILYHFIVIGGKCPTFGNEIKTRTDKRLTLWADEVVDDGK